MNSKMLVINLKEASDQEYALVYALTARIRSEQLPDDPPYPLEAFTQRMRSLPDRLMTRGAMFLDEKEERALAFAILQVEQTTENQHSAVFDISVLPEYRRQGLARNLLRQIVDWAVAANRRLLMSETFERIPAGEAFLARVGGRKGLAIHTNQLDLDELNRGILEAWIDQAQERASGFSLVFLQGAYPDERLGEIARLSAVMNQQPVDNLDVDDRQFTPEFLRDVERSMFADGSERWTCIAVNNDSSVMAGFTETIWNPARPYLLTQGNTGVWPEYRNLGIGRWLKAAMIQKILEERPQVKFIRTGNADSNRAMLNINHALGFKPYLSQTIWQVETANIIAYLSGYK